MSRSTLHLSGRRSAFLAGAAGLTLGLVAAAMVRAGSGRSRRAAKSRSVLVANARRALHAKQANETPPGYPASTTAHHGMQPLPNTDIAPSGALDAEGHRPVLERSRKER
jgi:hypothetical protein